MWGESQVHTCMHGGTQCIAASIATQSNQLQRRFSELQSSACNVSALIERSMRLEGNDLMSDAFDIPLVKQ